MGLRDYAMFLLIATYGLRASEVVAMLRWYHAGADVDAKLQLLATYLGHGSALSTHHYLHFIEPMRAAASKRFARLYGSLIVPAGRKVGRVQEIVDLRVRDLQIVKPFQVRLFGKGKKER